MAGVVELIGKINSDLTDKFPFKYFIGNRYIMVTYDYNKNDILTEVINICERQKNCMHMTYQQKG